MACPPAVKTAAKIQMSLTLCLSISIHLAAAWKMVLKPVFSRWKIDIWYLNFVGKKWIFRISSSRAKIYRIFIWFPLWNFCSLRFRKIFYKSNQTKHNRIIYFCIAVRSSFSSISYKQVKYFALPCRLRWKKMANPHRNWLIKARHP